MKKIFVLLVVSLFLFSCFTGGLSAKELKVAIVDIQKVFNEYEKTKKAESELESKGKAKTEERKKKVESIRRLKDEMELLSEKNKEEKQLEVDEKIKDLQGFDIETRNELLRQREDMIKDISKNIDKSIKDYGKKKGYNLILNKAALLYEEDVLDVTEDIIKELNK